jgi:predicted dehydrogenase
MTIKFAVAGAGYIANYHARAIASIEDAEMAAVVEKYPEKAADFAERYDITNRYSSVEELAAAGDIDALVVGTPNFLHAHQTITALRADIHVMVEKPMGLNALEARAMLEADEASEACLMVAHCWRFDREVLWLKRQLDDGQIGRITRTKGYGVHTHWGPSGWFTQKALAGGGALADMGIHAIDTARFLLGDPLPESVYAVIDTHYGDYDVDDTGIILIRWANGATSYIESGWWQPHMDGPEASTRLYGLRGYASVFPTRLEIPNPEKGRLEVVDEGFPYPREEHCPQEMYTQQMDYFACCIRTGKPPNPGGAEGLVNMLVVDAAYQSSETGEAVKIQAGGGVIAPKGTPRRSD